MVDHSGDDDLLGERALNSSIRAMAKGTIDWTVEMASTAVARTRRSKSATVLKAGTEVPYQTIKQLGPRETSALPFAPIQLRGCADRRVAYVSMGDEEPI